MKAFNNYSEAAKAAQITGGEKLPAGAYKAQIKNVQYQEGKNGNSDIINILFDITDGEYKGFFKSQYDNNTNEDKKWKGRASIWVPSDDGSEKDEWTKKTFANWTTSLEQSNKGYTWDWDENKWKGKAIGLVFREVGNVIEGRECVYTEVAWPCAIGNVSKQKPAAFKAKNGYTGNGNSGAAATNDFMNIPDGVEEECPF